MRFQHYKGGIYTLLFVATHTESGEDLVIYRDEKFKVWARPFDMFYGYTEDGEKRFTPLPDPEHPLTNL